MARTAGLFGRLEEHLAGPADTETRRKQKLVVVVVAVVGAIATAFNAVPLFAGGLDPMGWTYVASGVYLAMGALALVVWPGAFRTITFLLLLDVLVFPGIVQVLSGGITSGLMAVPWLLFAPLGAALALGAVAAWVHLGLFTVGMVALVALDGWARGIGPVIPTEIAVRFNLGSIASLGLMAGASALYLVRQVERFRDRADRILFEILPTVVATRLKAGDHDIVDDYESVTVLFADIVDFTRLSADAGPGETVGFLDNLFREFDELTTRHGVEKIKTIGDAYMVAGGLPGTRPDHVRAMVDFALDLLAFVERRPCLGKGATRLRVGIHTGPVVAGLVGRDRFLYDLWGDTVNVASRMEATGLPDVIQVTQEVVDATAGEYPFRSRGPVEVKGKGLVVTYLLDRAGYAGATS